MVWTDGDRLSSERGGRQEAYETNVFVLMAEIKKLALVSPE
jgi:hypothetical protein